MNQELSWQPLAACPVSDLIEAREQLHQAVQIVAMVARSLKPKASDDQYANLEWSPTYQALNGQCVLNEGLWVGLRIKDFTLLIFDKQGIRCSLALPGQTQSEAIDFLKAELAKMGEDISRLALELPYEIPTYDTAKGAAFQMTSEKAFGEFSKFFHNADLAIGEAIKNENCTSEIRSWPHHFDIASLVIVEEHEDPEAAKSVGVGFSPGDENFPEPYFYITPWPYPDPDKVNLPELVSGAHWHTEGWVGALLKAPVITNAEDQSQFVLKFLKDGTQVAKSFLGGDS